MSNNIDLNYIIFVNLITESVESNKQIQICYLTIIIMVQCVNFHRKQWLINVEQNVYFSVDNSLSKL